MTNFEKIKQLTAKEFAEWLQEEEGNGIKTWCENRYCDNDGDCTVCMIEWLNEEVEE